ncbi:MAG TPA: glycosyltransferase family 9 protein [Bacteroidia bacterium]|nr:glycosyltransferase family 9 protein [Bacteroidia bacterium]
MPKVLVIRFSSIGDIVLTSPIIRCIKKQLPGATVHFLTKKVFLPVLEANPYIDKIYSIETDVKEIMDRLHSEEYDYIIDLHHNLRTLQVKKDLRRRSYSFPKLNIEKWLIVNLKINRLPNIHIVDRYFETVKALNVKNDGQGLDYFIPVNDEIDINSLPESHRNGYIGIIIGAGHFTKQFPEHKLISLCKKLNSPIVLLGGKEDVEKAKRIEAAIGINVFNACGKYSINQSASLVKQARKIITNDTGLMHIASAFKKDIISIWGNTIPEFGMYPYMPGANSHIMEIKGLKCRPCSKLGYDACPKKHFKCMEQISEEKIIKNL